MATFDTTFFVRKDSSTAANNALNVSSSPTSFEIKFVAFGTSGDLQLEQGSGNIDPDTKIQIGSNTYSFTYDWTANLPSTGSASNRFPAQFKGDEIVRITILNYPTTGSNMSVFFLNGQNATQAEMNAFQNGALSVLNQDTTPNPVPVCLAEGTLVLTPAGEVAVEQLVPGDLVMTRDHGPQPVVWHGASRHAWPGSDPKTRPVAIRAGALGPGCPAVDLVVSPQHKLLLADPATGREVLVPAIGLTNRPGIRQMRGVKAVTYHHLLLPAHAILTTAGAASESFRPGPAALKMLGWRQRTEVLRLFPALLKDPENGYGPLARPALTRRQAAETALSAPGAPENSRARAS